MLETMKDQIYKQRMQYTSMLESGKVKDDKRRQAMMDVINQLDQQLDDLDHGIITEESRRLIPKINPNGSVRGRSKSPGRNAKGSNVVEELQRQMSPKRYRLLKKAEKKKLTPEETKEQALYDIYQFYAK